MAKILIVDDASFMRSTLKYLLEYEKHEVVAEAVDGKEAVKLYQKLKPDLVTMDILMKGMDGLEALKTIREIDKEARIIMVTSIGLEEKQEETRKLGAIGYIRKPFKREEIVAELNRVLNIA